MTASSQPDCDAPILIPFLKWAGGKRWLTKFEDVVDRIPKQTRYVEPFLGSAAMFFHIRPPCAVLNDVNADLVETYRAIKSDWQAVKSALEEHQLRHLRVDGYYYEVRASTPALPAARAARFIYLNRTCFNGLYRVNQKGEFNVPRGTKDSVLLSTDDFELISAELQSVELRNGDFGDVLRSCGEGDFIFADPPYTVKHNHNGFIKYNEKLFSWADQVRLRDELVTAADRGASVMATNADHPSIHELYEGFEISIAERTSVMASSSKRRRPTSEVVVTINL
jgi:DNA adenine methylase